MVPLLSYSACVAKVFLVVVCLLKTTHTHTHTGLRKLVHRVHAIFFLLSGYEAEDAVVLLSTDMSSLRFMDVPGYKTGRKGKYDCNDHVRLMDYLFALSDAFEIATQNGDASTAYG